jgi:hypothetical protein
MRSSKAYLLGVAVTIALVAALIVAGVDLLPAVVLGLIAIAFFTAWTLATDRRTAATTARERQSDERDGVPSTPVIEDRETPLGATTEQHEEITPHDLPPGHPARPKAEAQAAESQARGGQPLTTGDLEDRPEVVRDDDLRTDVKEGGERRFRRDDVEWTAEDQGRGQVRGPRSSQ